MRLTHKLIGGLLAGATAAAVPACATTGTGYVVATYEEPPPPARAEYPAHRPGYVWVHGRWHRDYYNRWRWQPGYYERERAGYVYVRGHWQRRGNQYTWIEGRWMPRGSVVIRGRAY